MTGDQQGNNREASEGSGSFLVTAAFLIAVAGGIAFLYAYWTSANNLFLGVALAVMLGGVGCGLVIWAHRLMENEEVTGPREPLESSIEERELLLEDFLGGEQRIGRRRLLGWMVVAVTSTLAAAFVSVLRSFGQAPTPVLKKAAWKRGDRLVTAEGKPVSVDALDLGSAIAVFPENRVGSLAAQTLLIRVKADLLRLPKERENWAPNGNVAFSRICTHAGCPIGLYETREHLLLCPCHQSTFNVLAAAAPTSGPAARALPQLPLYVDDQKNLRAAGDFSEPPGPGFWNLPS